MSNKWVTNEVANMENKEYICVLFISRNKDNKDVLNFKERKRSFLAVKGAPSTERRFSEFVDQGVPGEMSRLYVSCNTRDIEKTKTALMIELLSNQNLELHYIEAITAGIAARKENAAEKKWFFDFDSNDRMKLFEFEDDIRAIADMDVHHWMTPHGYAVVVEHGFDTRTLLEKWGEIVTLKRDDLICMLWETKSAEN